MEDRSPAAAILAVTRGRGSTAGKRFWPLRDAAEVEQLLCEELGLLAQEEWERAAADLEAWKQRGIDALTIADERYPESLRRHVKAPPLLFVRGDGTLLSTPSVAVIGTRQPSERGLRAARAISGRLVADGFTVISGLASGIDTAAHEATLAAGGRTVAVIGTGLDHVYPRSNAALQARIAQEGCVISQFWPDAPPTRRSFPMRNGVMAALAGASVIVEAGERSGTRIAARFSLAAGRRVLLLRTLLEQEWARELADQPGVEIVGSPTELSAAVAAVVA